MRLTLILISALIISSLSVAQNLHVYEAAKTFFTTGKRVMIEDSLGLTTEFIIKEKGGISFSAKNGWVFSFDKPGRYTLDSVYAATINSKMYQQHDSTYKAKWFLRCRETFRCGTCNLYRPEPGHSHDIEPIGLFAKKSFVDVPEPAFRLEWIYPKSYDRQYHVIIWNMFDDFLDVVKTTNSYVDLDLRKYDETAILYRIVSDECITSTRRGVSVKTKR